jgi:peptide/nickel transport system substrate-binding protein
MSDLKLLQQWLSDGRITRREFLGRASALGLTAGLSTTLLGDRAFAGTPKKGGRLRLGITDSATSDSLDPATLTTVHATFLCFGELRNNLVEIDHEINPIPELAESWESTPDAATWTFKLRQGVEFHNGKTLDAEDVIYLMNYHRGATSKSGAKGIVDPITDIKADGKHTVVFSLAGGNADFPFILSDFHMQIFPDGTTDFTSGVGTGGYVLESYEPGVRSLTKRNPNYWKEGRAHFDEIEQLAILDVFARTNALMTDQVDLMNRCDRKTLDKLRQTPGIDVIQTNGTQHYTIPMHSGLSPFDNNDVRLALKYALDRQSLLDKILRGTGALGNDHPIGLANRFHATEEEIPQREYDPDKARFHLKKAGYSELTVPLQSSDAAFLGAVDAGVLYREYAAKAGINIEVERVSEDGYWSNIWLQSPWCFSYML